uniref:Uncharacterized protein n=1 Tax=Strigamia maritima TaxID=126957 RepID=T1IM86_STRMM
MEMLKDSPTDGGLVQAVCGQWIYLDNVNFCRLKNVKPSTVKTSSPRSRIEDGLLRSFGDPLCLVIRSSLDCGIVVTNKFLDPDQVKGEPPDRTSARPLSAFGLQWKNEHCDLDGLVDRLLDFRNKVLEFFYLS